ncbi:HD family phosphohydrolase [Fictibacillus sp. Mic-4]|uniref:HD family phosphohydrolase n=1 Tax=Fictibacillus sp. Mic-4 TaxID=3132826 RepID=UPI00041D2B5C|nr:HD family phosphohydrolase [Fictibacillus gelatini]
MKRLKPILKSKPKLNLNSILFGLVAVVLYLLLLSNVTPNTVNVDMYSISPRDIQSPIRIEMKEETLKKQNEAAEKVENRYTYKEDNALQQAEKTIDIFKTIQKINEESDKKTNKKDALTLDEKIDQLKGMVNFDEVSPEAFKALFNATPNELETAKDLTSSVINDTMSNKIKVDEVGLYRERAEEKIRQNTNFSGALKNAVIELTRAAIVPNYVFDAEKTRIARQKAIDDVDPVEIKEGEIIVREGEVITPEIFKQLKLVGLLDKDLSVYPYIGLLIFVIVIVSGLYYLTKDHLSDQKKQASLTIYTMLFVFSLLLMKLVSLTEKMDVSGIYYVVPIACGTMMIKILLDEHVAIITSLVLGICAALIFNESTSGTFNFTMCLYVALSGVAGVIYLGKRHQKAKIVKAGLFVALVNILSIAIILLLQNGKYSLIQVGIDVAFAILSGFLASILTLGFMPVMESWFSILSPTKLIELSNPNHPLLRKILTEAPGTYHHSVMVANLSEAACESIGANGLLARVGSYYHDVGKTKRPHFFIENQMNMENPHDKIAPQLSKTIIIAHPYDGAEMLKKYKIPKEIIDIAEQHHGTTLLKFFYHKAEQQSEKEIPESDFRYPGPKAQTKEAAVVGIADSVEAAVRSLSKPTPVKIESIIRKIITDRLEDGQFDECDLTLKELDTVARALCETLQGIFHSRIEYPEEGKKKVE